MALTHILAAIRRDATEECARIEARAEAEAEALLHDADERGALREREILRISEEEIAAEARRQERAARREAETARRALRGRFLESLFSALEERLAALREDPPSFRALTTRLLDQALTALPDADTLWIDARDENLVRELLRGRFVGSLQLRPSLTTWGGMSLERAGVHRVDNTLECRWQAARDELVRVAVSQSRALKAGTP